MTTAADSQPEGMPSEDAYALVSREAAEVEAPVIDFRPPMPKDRSIPIGLVGAGGISFAHLDAYKRHGLNVVAIADRHLDRAKARRDQHFPDALATDDIAAVIADPAIRVLDLTPHPESRAPLIRAALESGKHVLSQKPFVHDLALGEQLAALADEKGLLLAVNQNGRWSPHMAWMREAVARGLVGTVTSVHVSIQWDHSWVAGTPFDAMDDLILEDFGIHWFDFLVSVIGGRARSVYAIAGRAEGQSARAPLLGSALVSFDGGQASLVFDGATRFGSADSTVITGTAGSLRSEGPDLGRQAVTLHTEAGVARPVLEGTWFNDGFAGTMGALLVAIETGAQPIHAARANLASLRLGHAAIESVRRGQPVRL